MSLWNTRQKSLELLENDFQPQGELIERVFKIIDDCIGLFNEKAGNSNFHRVCGLTVAKARNFALGIYGLILDGLGQEAGALARPFVEYYELLIYFRLEPIRVQEAIDNKLPQAGRRAQLIEGSFQGYRDYLNEHASHSSFSFFALNHLIDKQDMRIKKEQQLLPKVLLKNLTDFFIQTTLIAIEAVNCLETVDKGSAEKQAYAVEILRRDGIALFGLRNSKS